MTNEEMTPASIDREIFKLLGYKTVPIDWAMAVVDSNGKEIRRYTSAAKIGEKITWVAFAHQYGFACKPNIGEPDLRLMRCFELIENLPALVNMDIKRRRDDEGQPTFWYVSLAVPPAMPVIFDDEHLETAIAGAYLKFRQQYANWLKFQPGTRVRIAGTKRKIMQEALKAGMTGEIVPLPSGYNCCELGEFVGAVVRFVDNSGGLLRTHRAVVRYDEMEVID